MVSAAFGVQTVMVGYKGDGKEIVHSNREVLGSICNK